MMIEKLDWIENAAVENLRLQHHTADVLAKESATTLTVLLAGLGAGTAYAVRALTGDAPSNVELGAVAFTIYLLVLCIWLVVRCLMIQPIPSIFNEPQNLLTDLYTLDEIRSFDLEHKQEAIEVAGRRNGRLAWHLNRIRLAAVLSPICFLVAFVYPLVVGA